MRATPARADGDRVEVAPRFVDDARVRAIAVDAAVLVILTGAAAAVYAWTKPALYNPFGSVDPWLYTALWTNFDQIYHAFSGTYYISRLPWIVPGYVLNSIFGARTAALVFHATLFLTGGVLFYVLCRRWLGVVAAAAGYVALIGSQMYFNAHRWDYEEGGVLTYMIAAYAFSIVRTRSPLLRAGSLALGGLFAAAMVTTRLIDGAYLVGLPLLYVVAAAELPPAARLRQLGRDVVAFAAGAAALLVACGVFAKSHGEEFLFFMPQVRVARSSSGGGYNQIPVDQWLPSAPYFWVPLFTVLFAAVVLVVGPRHDRVARRVLLASALWLTLDYVGFALWQFLSDGWLFNLVYYFSSFLLPTLLCLTSAAAVVLGAKSLSRRSILVGIACAVAVLAPVVWIYRSDSGLRVATSYGDAPYVATFVAMGTALLLAILARVPRLRAFGAAAVAAAFFAVAYGVDASNATFSEGASDPRTGGLYDVGQKLIGYLRVHGYKRTLPRIWYDASDVASGIGSIQSLYYYALTYIDGSMPAINDNFRFRISVFRPKRIVLLCTDARCTGAGPALRRAGYEPRLQSLALLASDDVHVWVRIYKIHVPTA